MAAAPVWVHTPAAHYFEYADRIAGLGLHPELYLAAAWLETAPAAALESIARDGLARRFDFILHAPFMNLDAGADDPAVLAATRRRLRQAVDVARRLNATSLVCHTGHDPFPGEPLSPAWLERSAATWRELLGYAPEWMAYHLENIRDPGPEVLLAVLDAVGSPRLRACWDFGHCNLFSKLDPLAWADRLGPRLGELHLHDNRGAGDEHLALGAGSFPAAAVLDRLAAAGWRPKLTIEGHTVPAVAGSVAFLAPYRERFGEPGRG